MEQNFRFQVDLGGMIDLLSNHLYSNLDVFIRELLQNSADAITARKKQFPSWQGGRIELSLDPGKSLTFYDNGIGLTEEEIHTFLTVIGQSSKRASAETDPCDSYIGHFGIGLLSCFMVTNQITLHTQSPKDHACMQWKGLQNGTYFVRKLEQSCPIGTTLYLEAKESYRSQFTMKNIARLVRTYGIALPFPIYLKTENGMQQLNEMPQMHAASHEDVMQFGEMMFGEPFFDYIPIQSKYVNGFAYILPYKVHPTVKNKHRIFLKYMFLTENGDKLLPEWAFFLRFFLNTNGLRPTASRESFVEDEALLTARNQISSCIAAYLAGLARRKPDKLQKLIQVNHLGIKSIAIANDELFTLFIDYLPFETSEGEMTGKELRAYAPAPVFDEVHLQYEFPTEKSILYTSDVERFRQMLPVFLAQNRLLLNCGYVYDYELIHKLNTMYGLHFSPLDEDRFEDLLEELSLEEEENSYTLLKTANRTLIKFHCAAEVKRYKPLQMPAFYLLGEKTQLLRELHLARETSHGVFSDALDAVAAGFGSQTLAKLYLNLNNPLIQKLLQVHDTKKLACCIEMLYVQALLLGRFPMKKNELQLFNLNLLQLLDWGVQDV